MKGKNDGFHLYESHQAYQEECGFSAIEIACVQFSWNMFFKIFSTLSSGRKWSAPWEQLRFPSLVCIEMMIFLCCFKKCSSAEVFMRGVHTIPVEITGMSAIWIAYINNAVVRVTDSQNTNGFTYLYGFKHFIFLSACSHFPSWHFPTNDFTRLLCRVLSLFRCLCDGKRIPTICIMLSHMYRRLESGANQRRRKMPTELLYYQNAFRFCLAACELKCVKWKARWNFGRGEANHEKCL